MTGPIVADDLFPDDRPATPAPVDDGALHVALDAWEGPLDLLLTLARHQRVDLRQISILALVDQYLDFIDQARSVRIELAADYLVMAAWLALLKSALLLPRDPEESPSADELALRLQLRLQRLAAMRDAGARLVARDRLGRDVFRRGTPEGLRVVRTAAWQASIYDLLVAYGQVQARTQPVMHMVARRHVMTLEEALERLSVLIGTAGEWTALSGFLPAGADAQLTRSATASSFVAALELARTGMVEIAQEAEFAPLMLRRAVSA